MINFPLYTPPQLTVMVKLVFDTQTNLELVISISLDSSLEISCQAPGLEACTVLMGVSTGISALTLKVRDLLAQSVLFQQDSHSFTFKPVMHYLKIWTHLHLPHHLAFLPSPSLVDVCIVKGLKNTYMPCSYILPTSGAFFALVFGQKTLSLVTV